MNIDRKNREYWFFFGNSFWRFARRHCPVYRGGTLWANSLISRTNMQIGRNFLVIIYHCLCTLEVIQPYWVSNMHANILAHIANNVHESMIIQPDADVRRVGEAWLPRTASQRVWRYCTGISYFYVPNRTLRTILLSQTVKNEYRIASGPNDQTKIRIVWLFGSRDSIFLGSWTVSPESYGIQSGQWTPFSYGRTSHK